MRGIVRMMIAAGIAAAMVISLPALAAEALGRDDMGFGAGVFGKWIQDKNWLPAYVYTMRYDDPRSVWDPKVLPKNNLQWHQLGNDRVTADAYNLGMVRLFYGESGAEWLNDYDPKKNAFSGGFGWLIDGATVLVDRDDYAPAGAKWERVFGTGYYRKTLETGGLKFERVLFAPKGDFPVLFSEVTVTNESGSAKDLRLIEYWDVNIHVIDDFLLGAGLTKKFKDRRVRMSVVRDDGVLVATPPRVFGPDGGFPERAVAIDPELPALFLASLNQKPEAWITDPASLFHKGALVTDASALLSAGSAAQPAGPLAQHKACLALRLHIKLAAGEHKTVRFAYGYSKGEGAAAIVDRLFDKAGCNCGALLPDTMWYWASTAPRLNLPMDRFMGRELSWDYYYFTSASLYDAYYQKHDVPQGANYLYASGGNGATRDFAAFVMTLAYYRPDLAREILEFMTRSQETDGRLFYDLAGFGTRYNVPYRPGDLDLWFLWALSEYVYATRDFAFLDQIEPFYPMHSGESGTVWEHARRSLDHLVNVVGVGPHGNPKLRLSDWNDEMMWLTAGPNPVDMVATYIRGESVMNAAMATLIMPEFGSLARTHGDDETAKTADTYLAGIRHALEGDWHEDHLVRSYSGLGRAFGKKDIYLEPQAWALLSGALSPEREKVLVDAIVKRLKDPSAIGMMISTSTSGSLTTRPGEQEEGGVWFAINAPAAVALSRFDPSLGWDEVVKNSLAWHGHVYPDTWYGIWSGPDAWNSVFSKRPADTWYMKTYIFNTGPQMYPVQNAHSHCQTMWAIARLAGMRPEAEGWAIEPLIPADKYSFTCSLYGIEVSPGKISGYVRLPVDAELRLRVKLPEGWDEGKVKTRVEEAEVEHEIEDGYAVFSLTSGPDRLETRWEVSKGR